MKKISTLIVALAATMSGFAQTHSASMNFIGNSDYSATVVGMTISGNGAKDTLVVADGNTSITFPAMTVKFMGANMTVPSMKIAYLTYTMTGNPMTGNAVFTWEKGETDTTVIVNNNGKEESKTLKISSLNAVYTHATGALDVTFAFQYGSMPGVVTFKETGYYTVANAWNLIGRGKEANPYRIYDAADFKSIADSISATNTGNGEYFQMMNDVDFGGTAESAVQLPAIGYKGITNISTVAWGFQGTFDGNGKSISGIYHTNNGNDINGKFQALFSSLGENGTVKNLTFTEKNSISSYNYAAPFVSINKGGVVDNCVNNAPVTAANAFAGGICGYLAGGKGTIQNCTNNAAIKANTYATGIVAGTQSSSSIGTKDADYQNYVVSKCVNNGTCSSVNGVGSAGIAGSYSGVITDCVNNGTIDDVSAGKSGQNTAGIVSCMTYIGGVTGNVNKGTVKGVKSVAGIVGKVMKGSDEAFDLTDNTNEGTIEATSAKGDILGASARTQQDVATGIADVCATSSAKTYKTLVNGRLVIVNAGKQYNAAGAILK